SDTISRARSLREQIVSLRNVISRVSDHADIELSNVAFGSFFSNEASFISSLRSAATASTEFVTELNEKVQAREIDQSIGAGIINAITLSGLKADADRLEDDVRQNRNTVDAFFDSLSANVDQFIIRFEKRMQNAAEEVVRKKVAERLLNDTNNYSDLVLKKNSIDPVFDGTFKESESLLAQARTFYENANYSRTNLLLGQVEEKLDFLSGKVGSWPPQCGENKYWTGSSCACTPGFTEQSGKCIRPSSGVNWVLVGALAAALAVAIVIYKKKGKGGGKPEQPNIAYTYFGGSPK
ncbi:hypothetical protein HY546_01845, partial [archaeon]|nr:hypothetical protein [archaeon]